MAREAKINDRGYSTWIALDSGCEIEVGTNGFHGGNRSHGGRTYFRFSPCGQDIAVKLLNNEGAFEINAEGDWELDTLIYAFDTAAKILKRQIEHYEERANFERDMKGIGRYPGDEEEEK